MKRFFKNIVVFLNLIVAITLAIILLSVKISPADFWAPALIGLAYPYVLFINLLFVLYWLFASPKWALLSLVVILIGFNHLENYFQFIPKKTEEKGIVVCSYNVKGFSEKGYKKAQENAQDILDYLKEKHPDIVCFQEMSFISWKGYPWFKKNLNLDGIPKYADADRKYGPVTFTNFPIVHKEEIHFDGTANMIVLTDVVTPKDTVRIFNCHLESYRFTPGDIRSLDSLSINKKKESIKEFRLFGSKLKKAFIKRAEQAKELRKQIDLSPYPVIVCGDFNDTPVSYSYHTVRGDLKDAFVESGAGIGNTYLGKLPSFRIDYIMHSSDFTGYNFKIDHVDYSDHYPVSCKLIPTE
ncbi:endonuclease/exonuclease/phosphatase family protein [Mangrovibacterium lignilyticum]|uniref:endonuclease/exonuclease/phosphatase family protein n=1 Tax=Mangrovibacterium lignilyticum TaxID=2668052 RepID=UPI0013D28035|nr:endonuclease/exonuclease/phosphatase family protein [Mangrovibacterium lignilyticum]